MYVKRTATSAVIVSAHLGRPRSSTLAMKDGRSFCRAIVRRILDGRKMHSRAMAKTPMIMQILIKSGMPLIPASWTEITNGEAATPEPPKRRGSFEGTMIEMSTVETR